MENIKNYNEYIKEMLLNRPNNKIPAEYFDRKEIETLSNNESGNFNLIEPYKALCQMGKYRITIHKRSSDDFYYRIRDTKKPFSPIIMENRNKTLRDCLYHIDDFMWERIKLDKEKEALAKKLEKERLERKERGEKEPKKPININKNLDSSLNGIFAGRSFGGKFNM